MEVPILLMDLMNKYFHKRGFEIIWGRFLTKFTFLTNEEKKR